jgi:tyrocidine synthetase-3
MPQLAVSKINYLTAAEKQYLLAELNEQHVAYPKDKTIIQLFEDQAALHPDKIAVVAEGNRISYEILNRKANQLAGYLRTVYAVKPDDLLGIRLGRGIEMIVAILGVLKSGAAYVPVDPEYPEERISFMLEDSKCKVVIDETILEQCSMEGDANLPLVNNPQDLAYVIYTSGTTGKPKGAQITHNNVVRLLKTEKPLFDFSAADVWTMFHSYCFDFSVWEMYGALLFGGTLVMVPSATAKDPAAFLDMLLNEGVTVLNQTPSAFYNLIREELERENAGLKLRFVIFGGEALSPGKLAEWKHRYPATDLVNMYGITETTVHVTYKLITDTEIAANSSSIGRPIPTLSCYVMDQQQQLLPVGISGELYVGGEGVCRGYLNREELTNQRFITNPYNSAERLYRSGDSARLLENGELEYAGRIDDQVKIRGYRIELGEIAYALGQHPDINDTIVIARPDKNNELRLVAYLVSTAAVDASELRSLLAAQLPAYMIPDYFVQLKKMPLTGNGKIYKKGLPDPEGIALDNNVGLVAPRNPIEEKLVRIWENVLGRTGISVQHNFFECGGHSIKITRLASLIHKEFGIKIALKDLFAMARLEEQAAFIEQSETATFVNIQPVPVQADYPVSSSQQRLWVLSQFEGSSKAYYILGKFYMEGVQDVSALEKALKYVIARHEILRTTFRENEEGELRQVVHPVEALPFSLGYKEFAEEEVNVYLDMNDSLSFDLAEGPLLRVGLIRVAPEKYILHFNMHHIISDGWSMDLLKDELMSYYQSFAAGIMPDVQPLKIQYKDYAVWQQQQLSGDAFEVHRSYWQKQLSGTLPVLQLPLNRARPSVMGHKGYELVTVINHETTDGLSALCRMNNATFFMGLLAVMNTLLYRYSGQEDIIIGCPIAGREHTDLEDQIGLYVNTLVMRTRLSGKDTISDLLDKVRDVTLSAYSHQLYPFDKLIEELNVRRDVSRSAIFDVIMAFQNQHDLSGDIVIPENHVYDIRDAGNCSLKTDLHISFAQKGDGLHMNVQYNTDIFDKDTIVRFIEHYKQLLLSVSAHPRQSLAELDYLPPKEKERLLQEFNDTATAYLPDVTIAELFNEQVILTPERIALEYQGKTISYRTLDESSNQFAHFLRKKGVTKGMLVPICIDRSPEMIIGILGIMKSGAAYVPIDPAYPQERIAYMLSDINPAVIVSDTYYKELFEEFPSSSKIFMDRDRIAFEMEITGRVDVRTDVEDLAYVIYTSGSTGNPKGVMIQHGSLYNYLSYSLEKYMNDDDRIYKVPLFTSLSFDLTVTSIFCTLLKGGELLIYLQDMPVSDIMQDVFFGTAGINFLKCTPSHIELLREVEGENTSVQGVILGGEELRWSQVTYLQSLNPDITVYNEYGPTEATVGCIVEVLEGALPTQGNILIGKPISNVQIFILDETQQLVGIDIPGEIYIGGAQLAKGYLNREDLSAEKFITHPLRLYRTGDVAKWLPDGNIEYIGRLGDQVKILGYRIEPGEVEQALLKLKGISSACVVPAKDAAGNDYLTAYVVSREEQTDTMLRQGLLEYIPAYMIPSRFKQLDMIPLTTNGKADRQALPDPETYSTAAKSLYVQPVTNTEKVLVEAFERIFGTDEPIGIKDNFFELGGNSLKAISFINKLKQLGHTVKIDDVLRYPVLEQLALKVTQVAEADVVFEVMEETNSDWELSFNQQIYYVNNTVAHAYGHFRFQLADFDKQRFIDSYAKVIAGHDVLRLKFLHHDGKLRQQVLSPDEVSHNIKFIEKEKSGLNDDNIQVLIDEFLQEPFDIYNGQVIKCAVMQYGQDAYILIAIHHLATDTASNAIIKRKLIDDYNGRERSVPASAHTYRDFIFLQRQYLQSSTALAKIQFWEDHLKSLLLKGVLFNAGNKTQIIASREIISGERFEELYRYCKQQNVFMSTLMLSVFYNLVCDEYPEEEFIIETVVSGQDMDLPGFNPELVTGLFTGTLPLKFSNTNKGYSRNAVLAVQQIYMAARANQDIPSVYIRRLFEDKYHFPLAAVTRYHMNYVDESGEMEVPEHYNRYSKVSASKRLDGATLPVKCFEYANGIVLKWENRCTPEHLEKYVTEGYYLKKVNDIIDRILSNGSSDEGRNWPDRTDMLNFSK